MADETGDFCHNEDTKGHRGYMITAFAEAWDELYARTQADRDFIAPWCGLWNYERLREELAEATKDRKKPVELKHITWQVELCPSTERVHTHMVFWMGEPVKFMQLCDMKNKIFGMASFLKCDRIQFKGIFKIDGALKYCTKEETRIAGPWTEGNLPKQGQRSDLMAVADTIQEAGYGSAGIKRAAEQHPAEFMRYHGGITRYARLLTDRPPSSTVEDIVCCWGMPGSGKTYYAEHLSDSVFAVPAVKNNNVMPYFDNYRNEEVLFVDEMQGSLFAFAEWKKLFNPGSDPTKRELLCRESAVPFGSRVVVFCTNRNPLSWWDIDKLGADPWEIIRRFTRIRVYGGEFDDADNPAWFYEFSGGSKSATGDSSRATFMRISMTAKQAGWDLDYSVRRFKELYGKQLVYINTPMGSGASQDAEM